MGAKLDNCPGCGAPKKYPDEPDTLVDRFGRVHRRPIVFTCGTVASLDWTPPVYDKNCKFCLAKGIDAKQA